MDDDLFSYIFYPFSFITGPKIIAHDSWCKKEWDAYCVQHWEEMCSEEYDYHCDVVPPTPDLPPLWTENAAGLPENYTLIDPAGRYINPRQFFLEIEKIFETGIVAFAPDLVAGCRVNQLDINTDLFAYLADAALDNTGKCLHPQNQSASSRGIGGKADSSQWDQS